jgi:pyruvate ferredoxin oxidoreductase gamma subunit
LLAAAALKEGKRCQAFPFFGPEKRGAPVMAFARIGEDEIVTRTQIQKPDYVIVMDPSLLGDPTVKVTDGLKEGGVLIANTSKPARELGFKCKVFTVDATKIALDILGAPIPNTAVLGAFAAATGEIKLDSIKEAIREQFPGEIGEKNVKVIETVYKEMIR